MEKNEKRKPRDSARHLRKEDQAVVKQADDAYKRRSPKTEAPALKREFSEQPPTKHNSKT